MKSLLTGVLLCAVFGFTSSVSASSVPGNLQVLGASDSSISLDWEDSEDVIGYYAYYGTQTGSGADYEIEGIDLIDTSEFTIEDLQAETRYYIALTSVDEFGTESAHSQEVEYVTLAQGQESQSVSFRISDVNIIDDTSLELIFSTDLELGTGVSREFIIANELTGSEVSIDITDVIEGNPRNVIVVLGEPLSADTQYKVTVLDISDAEGNTIESGIDAFINFHTSSVFTDDLEAAGPQDEPEDTIEPVVVEDTNDASEQITKPSNNVEGNNGGTTIPNTDNVEGKNGGITISNTQISAGASQVAGSNETLPTTGPEHWILAMIAFLLAGGAYYSFSRKRS